MKLSISKSKDVVSEAGSGGNFIGGSGIYDVTINFASVAQSDKSEAQSVNFNITYNGNTQTIWGPYVTDKEGNDIEIGSNLILKLGLIAGMEDGDELEFSEETFKVGKDNTPTEFTIIDQFTDLDVKMYIKQEFSRYNGKITERLALKAFFRSEDGASAEEIVNDKDFGKRLAETEEKYASTIGYLESSKGKGDAPTPEEVADWIANGRGKGTKGTTPKSTAAPKKKAMFARK